MTKIESKIEGGAVCEQTGADHTDKRGDCVIVAKNSLIPQTGPDIKLVKNPDYYLTSKGSFLSDFISRIFSLFSAQIQAQQRITIDDPTPTPTGGQAFDPILTYLEGYAYDQSGKAIPKAKVQVKLTMNQKLFYQTVADDSGFFTVYKNNLPPLAYYLEFVDPTTFKTTKQTTSQFVESNQSYLDQEETNLMAATKYGQPVIDKKTGKLNPVDKNFQAKLTPSPAAAGKSAFNNRLFIILLILAFLFISLLGVVLYIKKSQSLTKPY